MRDVMARWHHVRPPIESPTDTFDRGIDLTRVTRVIRRIVADWNIDTLEADVTDGHLPWCLDVDRRDGRVVVPSRFVGEIPRRQEEARPYKVLEAEDDRLRQRIKREQVDPGCKESSERQITSR